MSKIAAIAAAVLAGTSLASAAHADAVRVGFGFPLGSFVAHSNESYTPAPRAAYTPPRRVYAPEPQIVRKAKPLPVYAKAAPTAPAVVQTAKLEQKLPAASADTSVGSTNTTNLAKTTDGSNSTASVSSDAGVETPKNDKIATTEAKTDKDGNPVCRRYSPTVGGLVDVACDK